MTGIREGLPMARSRERKEADGPRRPPQQSLEQAFLAGDVSREACGWRLRLVRSTLGQTRDEFAPTIGMGSNNLHSVESGKSYLRPVYGKLLFENHDVNFDFIYYGDPRFLTVNLAARLLDAVEDLPPPERE